VQLVEEELKRGRKWREQGTMKSRARVDKILSKLRKKRHWRRPPKLKGTLQEEKK